MNRKRKVVAFYEIFLLISLSFAISFIISENEVSASPAAGAGFIAGIGDAFGGTVISGTGGAVVGNALIAGVLQGALWGGIGLLLSELLGFEGKAKNALVSAATVGGVVYGVGLAINAGVIASAAATASAAGVGAAASAAATTAATAAGLGTAISGPIASAASSAASAAIAAGATPAAAASAASAAATTAATTAGVAPAVASSIGAATGSGVTSSAASAASAGIGTFPIFLIAIVVVAIIFVFMYRDTFEQKVSFTCEPYQAPLGGGDCEKCNVDNDCTEYECRSLGQGCKIVNPGESTQACVWVDRNDVTSPVITPWAEANSPFGIQFTNHQSRPPSPGVQLIDSNTGSKCLRPYTPIFFGLQTDEPATCKLAYNHTETIEEMGLKFIEGVAKVYNHTAVLSLPDPNDENVDMSPYLQPDGTFSLFARCQDENGNENIDEFAISFCVEPNPDITAPRIEGYNIRSGSPVRHGVGEVPIEVYTNEPASCKWSLLDQGYANMENGMNCVTSSGKSTASLIYKCSGTLKGIQDSAENKFYFTCVDKEGNEKTEREEFVLLGTKELNIIDFTPKIGDVITGSTSSVEVELTVETDDGAYDGKAICSYKSQTGLPENYVVMFDTNTETAKHSQSGIQLSSGEYSYDIQCVDDGGNEAVKTTSFSVFVDDTAPNAVRAYKQAPNSLRVVTDEDASCVYDYTSCNYEFDLGQAMLHPTVDEKNIQLAEWKTGKTYYIKCRDEFGNEPSPNECSIIVRTV